MPKSSSVAFRFDHAAVPVSDARAAYELFANVLELPLMAAYQGEGWDDAPWLMMMFGLADGGQVALCARAGAKPPPHAATDLPHFALGVRDARELAEWRKKLAAAGFNVRDEDHGEQQSIYFEDHSGLTWEVATSVAPSKPDPQAHSVVANWLASH